MINKLSPSDKSRWEDILEKFRKKQELAGYSNGNPAGLVVKEMENIVKHLDGIREEMLLLNLRGKPKEDENK